MNLRKLLCPVTRKIFSLLLLAALVAVPAAFAAAGTGPSSRRYIRYTSAYGKTYVYLRDVARFYGMNLVRGGNGCELRSRYSRIKFTYDRKEGFLNGVKVYYMLAPAFISGEPLISKSDFLLFIDPVLRKSAVPARRLKVIMIDPGHGGRDEGARGTKHKEKDITLPMAFQLRDLLVKKGYRVILTRDSDRTMALSERTELAAKLRPDLFISLHCNSADASVRGAETFCLPPAGTPPTYNNKASKKEKGNNFDSSNSKLAYEVQKGILSRANPGDRGVKRARFYVLKHASCPAILVEAGFLSNYSEQNVLGTWRYRNYIAQGICDGVIRYHRALVGK